MVSASGSSGTVNVLSGSSNVTVVQIHLNNSSNMAVTLTQLNLAGSGGNPSGITSVSVLINDTPAGSPTAFSGNPVNVNLNNYVLLPGSQTLQILANFSGTANGTFQLSIDSMAGNSANNGGQPAAFTGVPVSGYTVTVQPPTSTPTLSPTATSTFTATVSPTSTTTPAPTPISGVVGIYPNPVTGPIVQILPPFYPGTSDVRLEVFTLAFRKVQDTKIPALASGIAIPLGLTGWGGDRLANGIYYVAVTTKSGRAIGKLLILR
jgi:hypothetical protein